MIVKLLKYPYAFGTVIDVNFSYFAQNSELRFQRFLTYYTEGDLLEKFSL
jgi:hypothetical protein